MNVSESATGRERGRHAGWVVVLLVALCAVVFGRSLGFDFVDYDDGDYVQRNPEVLAGLTKDGLWWALRTPHMGLWAPLTWLSYMLEVELLGPEPWVFHATNLLLHTLNAVLLFVLLRALTGDDDLVILSIILRRSGIGYGDCKASHADKQNDTTVH